MIKQRIKTRKVSIIAVTSFVIALLIGTSAVFSPQFFTASAYSQSELAQAEEAESLARQKYEAAYSEVVELKAIDQKVDQAGQKKILDDAVIKFKEKLKSRLTEIADNTIDDIADVYSNILYTQEKKLEKTENILDNETTEMFALMDELEVDSKAFYDEYIEVFLDDRVDYSYIHETVSTLIVKSAGYIDFLLWDLYLDMENGNDIEEKRDKVHEAIAEEVTATEYLIKYDVPGWITSCIDHTVDDIMGDLEETWQEKLKTLVEIRQELYQYDYSVNPEAINYTKNTYKSVTFKINGDLDAIKKIEHFDMQKTPVWSDAYQANVIFGERISLDEDYVLESGENNTIILKIKNAFLDKQTQGDHIFRLYYMTENDNEYVSFIVSSLPQGWVEIESYDDGQDWPMLAESEYMEEVVSTTDVDVTEQSSEPSGFRFMWIIVLAIILFLIAAAILIFLIIYKKKKKSLKNESENDIIKKEKASKKEKSDKKEKSIKPKTKNKNRTKKNLLSLFLVLGTLVVSFSSLNAYAASGVSLSVSNIRYTIPGNPPTVKKFSMSGNTVTVSGWGITYDFDILGWKSTDPEVSWENITITGNGVSVAKGAEGKATFTTTNNPTSGTRTAGTITINSPAGKYTFTVKQYVITYDIIYNANGGIGAPAQQSKQHLINIKLSSVKPTREGYTFMGWATSSAADKPNYKSGKIYKTNKHLSLYAVWKPNKVTITWNPNGGSTVLAWPWKTVGEEIGKLPTTKRDNCDSEGWYTGSDETGRKIYTFTKVPVRSTTYYAKWKLKSEQKSENASLSASPTTMSFTYNSTEKQTVTVKGYEGNASKINYWKKLSVSMPNWITVSKDSKGKLSISVKENKKTQARSGNIVLKSYDGDLCKIDITQSGKPVAVSSVSLDRNSVSIDIGETVILRESVYPEDAANKRVEWTSSNETIAKVYPNGIVRGLKQGKVTITVTTSDGNKTAKCKVTVKPPSITVTPAYVTLHVGEKTNLDVEFTPSYYTNDSITWSSSFSLFPAAKVDSEGKVTAIRPGKTVITAKTNDGRKSTCTVKVVKKVESEDYKTKLMEDIKNFNPLNCSEEAVVDANYFSFYKGHLVIKHPFENLSSCSYAGVMFINGNINNYSLDDQVNVVKHEYGHCQQYDRMVREHGIIDGTIKYTLYAFLPSVSCYWLGVDEELYYSMPWDHEADLRGGTQSTDNYKKWSDDVYFWYSILT